MNMKSCTLPTARLAIFDIDGTLCDSVALHQRSLLETLSAYKFPALNVDWGSYTHHTDTAIFYDAWSAGRGCTPGPAECAGFVAAHETNFRHFAVDKGIQEICGAATLVGELEARGWRIVFATGSIRSLAIAKLQATRIPFHPASLATASEFFSRADLVKDALRIASLIYGQHEWQAVSVGDGIWDFRTARLLGLPFVGIGHDLHQIPERDYDVLHDFSDPGVALSTLDRAAVSRSMNRSLA